MRHWLSAQELHCRRKLGLAVSAPALRTSEGRRDRMPVEVRVGPQVLTINHGSTVMITDLSGEIAPRGEQGVFAHDTRFVSSYRIFANGSPWLLLSSGTPTHYLARIQLVNPPFNTEDAAVAGGTLALTISRAV